MQVFSSVGDTALCSDGRAVEDVWNRSRRLKEGEIELGSRGLQIGCRVQTQERLARHVLSLQP